MQKYFVCLLLAGLLILSGCSTFQTTPNEPVPVSDSPDKSWQTYQQSLSNLHTWKAQGVIGIIINNKGDSANFIWKQDAQSYYIQIYGPMGLGAVTLDGDNDGITLTKNNGDKYSADDAQALMNRVLGWSVPVEGIYFWGRGLPKPDTPKKIQLNQFGLLKTLRQDGWQMHFSRYKRYLNQYPLPGKILMQKGNLTIKIILKSWQINP